MDYAKNACLQAVSSAKKGNHFGKQAAQSTPNDAEYVVFPRYHFTIDVLPWATL